MERPEDRELQRQERVDDVMDVTAIVTANLPFLGGPLSAILSGISTERKIGRVKEAILSIAQELKGFRSEVSEKYVATDEFHELLEKSLHKIADERNETRRLLYRKFLTDTIKNPAVPYDDRDRTMKLLDELGGDEFLVLRAMSQEPDPERSQNMTGSIMETLQHRLPSLSSERILEAFQRLQDFRLTGYSTLNMMMTGHGAEDLRQGLTPHAKRLLHYVLE